MNSAQGHAITVEEVTPEWLTDVLRRGHLLPQGEVVAIEKQPTSAFNSHTLFLKPSYSGADLSLAPRRLLLKCNIPAVWAQRAGAREVAFYAKVATLPDHPAVIVPCYDAAHEVESGNSHLLLHDLSESHEVAVERNNQVTFEDNLPTALRLEQAIDALARVHAYRWQHPQLGAGIAPIAWGCADEADFITEIARRGRALDALLSQEGEWFPADLRVMYENNLRQMMPIWQRYMRTRVIERSNLTLTHGDAYLANFLCPKEGQAGNAYIIDWQSPEAYRGSSDLVNMCATFWTREERAEDERELNVLRYYYGALERYGVRGYAWEELVRDYQLSIMEWLWIPVQDRFDGAGKAYWWPKLQCLAHAYEDWRVADLLV